MSIVYKQFIVADFQEVVEMSLGLYKEDPSELPMTKEKILNTCKTLLGHPDKGTILVAEKDDMIIGYAILIFFWSNEFGGNLVDIDELFIKKEHRGNGYGTAFIQHVIDERYGDAAVVQSRLSRDESRFSAACCVV